MTKTKVNVGSRHPQTYYVNRERLKTAFTFLKKQTSHKAKKRSVLLRKCIRDDTSFWKGSVITPFSYTYVMLELRKCILRHNWVDATKLLLLVLDGCTSYAKKAVWKAALQILLNHPTASAELVEDFIRMCSGIADAEEMLKTLMVIPNAEKLKPPRSCLFNSTKT